MATSWHLTSVTVLGGTLHGKKLDIEDVVVEVLIGSDPDCHLHLDLPTVSPIHARLWIEPDDVTVYGTRSGPGVFVNLDRVDGDGKLQPGDMLWLGPPQEAGSVMLQVHFEERDSLPPVTVSPLADDDTEAEASTPEGASEPLALEPDAFSEPLAIPLPASVEPVREGDAMPGAETPKEEIGVLAEEEIGVLPEEAPPKAPAADPPPSSEFDDFLVMDATAAAALPTASSDELEVSGFEAGWREAPEAKDVEAEVPEPASPEARPDSTVAPPADEDVFFIDDGAHPPQIAAASESHDSFFIDDGSLGSAPVTAPPPIPPPVSAPGDDLEDLAFAADFLDQKPSEAPALASAPMAIAKPVVAEPPAPRPAPLPVDSAPPARKAPPAVPRIAAVPVRSPSATNAVRPLPRPEGSSPGSSGARSAAARPDRTQPVRPRRSAARPFGRYAMIGGVALAILAGIWFAATTLMRRVVLERVDPQRVRVGDTVALVGRGFAGLPGDNVVTFDDKPANVATASPTRLEVVVPDVATPGNDVRAAVLVRVGRVQSASIQVSVYAGPVLHGISPDVAMPGDEVVLAGSGWGLAPTVRFGGLAAELIEARETSIHVRVPAIDGGPGTAAPVVVTSAGLESNPGPFYLGRIPLVTRAEPTSVGPGDVVTLSGRGFRRETSQNAVQVGGVRALVVSAFDSEIKVVVPRVAAGSRMLEVRVPSSVGPAQVPLVVTGATDALAFHFVAEPFDALPARDHAVLATALGPAFVLASSGGRSSAERALEAARRLNDAATSLKAARELTFDLRDADSKPTLGLVGRPELVVEVTEEDAGAYGEDWTGAKGRGGPVSAGRLGRWWEAVAKDLVLLLVRGENPHFTADLAPEGRVLADLFQSAQRSGAPPRAALHLTALRVPAGVRGPAMVASPALPSPPAPVTAPTTTAAQPMPRLDGPWTGSESEEGRLRYVTVTFRGSTGTIAYEGVMTVSAPLLSVAQPQRGTARFSVELRGGLRYYLGRWDGQALTGKIASDPGGAQTLGTFELRPR